MLTTEAIANIWSVQHSSQSCAIAALNCSLIIKQISIKAFTKQIFCRCCAWELAGKISFMTEAFLELIAWQNWPVWNTQINQKMGIPWFLHWLIDLVIHLCLKIGQNLFLFVEICCQGVKEYCRLAAQHICQGKQCHDVVAPWHKEKRIPTALIVQLQMVIVEILNQEGCSGCLCSQDQN